ncbi:hypothetical protein KA005_66615, partial [bacterium]|nr:hypothetical protein [bacterium]
IWRPYWVRRKKKVGVFPGGLHCTASGVAKWPKDRAPTFENFFRKDMLSEIEEEVGLLEEDIYDFKIVSLCREFARGGKPQMFFAAKTNLSLEELIDKRKEARSKVVKAGSRLEINDKWYLPDPYLLDIKKHKVTLEAIASLLYGGKYLS